MDFMSHESRVTFQKMVFLGMYGSSTLSLCYVLLVGRGVGEGKGGGEQSGSRGEGGRGERRKRWRDSMFRTLKLGAPSTTLLLL